MFVTKNSSNVFNRAVVALNIFLGLSFVGAVLTGLWMNYAWAADDISLMRAVGAGHWACGMTMIVTGTIHIYINRWWYRRLCTVPSQTWGQMASSRLLSLQTLMFVVVAVTGLIIGFGRRYSLIDFHQGVALLMALLCLVHIPARLIK